MMPPMNVVAIFLASWKAKPCSEESCGSKKKCIACILVKIETDWRIYFWDATAYRVPVPPWPLAVLLLAYETYNPPRYHFKALNICTKEQSYLSV